MNLLLIGHSIIDHIDGERGTNPKPGGIFYSTLGVLSLAKNDDKIFLLTSLNENSYGLFEKVYNQVDISYSNRNKDMPEVILKVSGSSEREEIYKNISTALDITKLEKSINFDGILINMITGFDINVDQLAWIRKKFNCPIYLDVHTLARGLDENMKRNFRPIPDAEKWLNCIDIIQCNEMELKSIVPNSTVEEAAKIIFTQNVDILVITKAEKGAEVFLKEKNFFSRISVKKENVIAKNKVGCGDFFGAAFFYNYIATRDVKSSLNLANKAGSVAAASENLTTYSKIDLS